MGEPGCPSGRCAGGSTLTHVRSTRPAQCRGARDPTSDSLVADLQPALGQQIFDISVAQSEALVEPYRLPDHVWRESVASVGDRLHAPG
jgi:hypothetical protein